MAKFNRPTTEREFQLSNKSNALTPPPATYPYRVICVHCYQQVSAVTDCHVPHSGVQ